MVLQVCVKRCLSVSGGLLGLQLFYPHANAKSASKLVVELRGVGLRSRERCMVFRALFRSFVRECGIRGCGDLRFAVVALSLLEGPNLFVCLRLHVNSSCAITIACRVQVGSCCARFVGVTRKGITRQILIHSGRQKHILVGARRFRHTL